MDDTIIRNINSLVKPDDTLWHLGDFCFGPREANAFFRKAQGYRNRINCKNVILIWGNHDPNPTWRESESFRRLFMEDYMMRITKINGQRITLCHYALKVWDKSHHGAWHLYGHSHGTLPDDPGSLSFDCGVDSHAFKPLNFHDVGAIMAKKNFKPIDHHGRE